MQTDSSILLKNLNILTRSICRDLYVYRIESNRIESKME
jgi:hypothetical protein